MSFSEYKYEMLHNRLLQDKEMTVRQSLLYLLLFTFLKEI